MLTLPALKLQQFGLTFYQAAVSADDIQKLVRFEVLAYEGPERRQKARRSGGVRWDLLEKHLATSHEAYQRPIIRKKIRELVQYYKQCLETSSLPAIPGAIILVSEKRLDFKAAGKNPLLGHLQLPAEEGILRALDGQHRLLALYQQAAEGGTKGFLVPAIIFDFLAPNQAVEMFVTINAKHTRLNPSHLISLQGRRLYPDRRLALCHDVIRDLQTSDTSALKGEIKLLGVGRGRVSQAALADEFNRVIEKLEASLGPRGNEKFVDGAKRFFHNYFNQIAAAFPTAWAGRKYSVKTAAALRAFIAVSPDVVEKIRARRADFLDAGEIARTLAAWPTSIGDARFETAAQWREKLGGGTRGTVELLTGELRAALGA